MKKIIFLLMMTMSFLITVGVQSGIAQKIPLALAGQLIKDDEGVREKKMPAKDVADQMNDVRKVDLNGDGVPEYIFSGIVCGNANCQTWIYRQNGNKYVRIPFEAYAVGIEIGKTSTKGYLDIIVEGHSSAAETELHVYKFDGRGYDIKECFSKKFAKVNSKTGRVTKLKTPITTKIKCGS